MKTFSISDAIKFGWETFKKRPGLLIGAFFITSIFQGGFRGQFTFDHAPSGEMTFTFLILFLVSIAVTTLAEIGMTTFAIRAHDNVETVVFKDIWNPKPFWYYLGMKILVGIIVLAGIILFIIPGIIAAIGLMFAPYLVIDKGLGPVEAMKESWRITMGHKWHLFLFGLALAGINILGLLALVVGLLVSVPVTILAVAHMYRLLEHGASEITPAPVTSNG
jgi:uncharacterized membrane protein